MPAADGFIRMLYSAGQPLRAEEMAARGLAISRSLSGNSELDAILEGNRAHALVALGRFDEAKALTEQAIASATERKDARWTGLFALYGAHDRLLQAVSLFDAASDKTPLRIEALDLLAREEVAAGRTPEGARQAA